MNKKMNYISSLISVGLITFVCFTASVQAQNCTPVVYAFRHAEDFNSPEGSKPVGDLTDFFQEPEQRKILPPPKGQYQSTE